MTGATGMPGTLSHDAVITAAFAMNEVSRQHSPQSIYRSGGRGVENEKTPLRSAPRHLSGVRWGNPNPAATHDHQAHANNPTVPQHRPTAMANRVVREEVLDIITRLI